MWKIGVIKVPVTPFSLKDAPALIERLLPVQKLSAEAYKEQMAGSGKTLTALGSYWKGRKPLILNKACILGCLLPATDDPTRDLEIFEMLMGMDFASLELRLEEKNDKLSRFILNEHRSVGHHAPYREWVQSSCRPEECGDELFSHIWEEVNARLGTNAHSFPELIEQLGMMRFGHRPFLADTFCGSGQIPFEAARLGCDLYASDLPSAVWSSNRKDWIDPRGHIIKTRGPEDIARCPFCIAIVSTGLIVHDSEERQHLLERKYGTVILDEAHKARRRGGLGQKKGDPNNLLDFMLRIGPRTRNLLLGTATPIQTEVQELWDLLHILNAGTDFVLGREFSSRWINFEQSLPLVKGTENPVEEREAWEWLRNPIPPAGENALFATLRLQLGLPDRTFFTDHGFGSLGFLEKQALGQALEPEFLRENNPILCHTVLRRRQALEDAGLLERIGVDIHPDPDAPATAYPGVGFSGLGLLTNHPFDLAFQAAEAFTVALQRRTLAAGFMKTLLLQRICSSFASGRATAERMLRRETFEDEEQPRIMEEVLSGLTHEETGHLRTIIEELARPEARDPKLSAVKHFLTKHRSEGKTWLEHGCIVFSQYYDTVYALGAELAKSLPGLPVGVYAGTGKSGLFRREDFAAIELEAIKNAVKKREIRLVVATDVACEGPKSANSRHTPRDVFEMRYQETIDPDRDRWELCSRVLARRDVVERLSIPW